MFNFKSVLALGNQIQCKASLQEAIVKVLRINPTQKKKVLEHFREIAVCKGLLTYTYYSNFQDLVDSCELEITYKKVKSVFLTYELTKDPIEKLWLKNKILKNYPHVIKNKQDFDQLSQYFRDEIKQIFSEIENELTSLDDFDQIESLDFLVPNLIPKQGLVLLTGQPKVSKSSLACEIAYSLVTGNPLFNQTTTKSKVLVVSLDENQRETKIKYIARGFKKLENDKDNIKFVWEINSLAQLEDYLKKYRPNLVIFDSLQQLTSSFNISENSAKLGNFLGKLKALLEKYNSAGLIIHHANKAKSSSTIAKIRGSSAIAASTSVNLFLEAKNNEITLTATGRDIVSCEYKLTLNERKNWQTMGVYQLLDDSGKNEIVEEIPAESEQKIEVQEGDLEKTDRKTAPTETIPESEQKQEASIKKKTPTKTRNKLTISQKIKRIVEQNGKMTKQEIIKEAVKIAISQAQVETHLKKLQKSGQITTLERVDYEYKSGRLFDMYFTVC